MSMPIDGDLAPEVALPDDAGVIHRLEEQRGRWTVLYFYPKDDTPGCTVEACGFRDINAELAGRGADVWGISPQGATSKRCCGSTHSPTGRAATSRSSARATGAEWCALARRRR